MSRTLVTGSAPLKRLALIDRDGTINVERHYLSSPEQLELLPGAAEGIRRLRELGLAVAVVTNQSAVARGHFDLPRLEEIHARLAEMLEARGAGVDAFYYCPHAPGDGCECRKPLPGMAVAAAAELRGELEASFVIGDKPCDIELGRAVGATTLLVRTGYGQESAARGGAGADYCVADLAEAADVIERLVRARGGERE